MGCSMLARTDEEFDVRSPADAGASGIVQRGAALLSLLAVAIPATLTAMLVWGSLGRPLLYRQERSGLAGRPFVLVKFRTMHEGRDAAGELLPDRLRETAATRLIRRLRLDEAPQLLAILAGDMSFVGPRPLKPETVVGFGRLGEIRGEVRPGLTGWAQVNGNTRLSDAEKLALDVWYVDHRSVALDVRILFLTAVTLVRGERVRRLPLAEAQAHLAIRAAGFVGERISAAEPRA